MSYKIETASLAAKVGSILVHADEAVGPAGHHFDTAAIAALLLDPEVQAWLAELRNLALIPVKR